MPDEPTVEQTTPQDANAGGQQAAGGERTFTQAELEREIRQRLTRERQKYADYDELKAAAARLAEIEEANKTDAQKAADELARAKAEAAAAKAEVARARAEVRLITLAAKAGVDSELAAALDLSKLPEDDDEALEWLGKFAAPKSSGGGASNPAGVPAGGLTEDEMEQRLFGGTRNRPMIFGG